MRAETGKESDEAEIIRAVLAGNTDRFESLVIKYSPRLFAMARRYARLEREVEDIVQEIWLKAFSKLSSFHGDAPFEHWLMRLGVRTCYDFLRAHQHSRERAFSELETEEEDWLEQFAANPEAVPEAAAAARTLVRSALEQLSPAARLVITLLEIDDRSLKEVSALTGWSIALVKVRAYRARAEMRRVLSRMARDKYL